ncbi:NADPH-dependent assimilatory sulfite reductase hemoprotein subunit [Sediminicoccus sp. KRV36]|uniref:NADPH-dependent assimilatory sulfite reductase hemoprotein subunit n=1 Tax=Sediminicoccus sp. KRV36 TaxID=3133721 RepID=UPI00200C5C6D|nr:NADPH-dependent assimilatory sulfite reductase hemoprotein subunit [Sediminicoccus rosea]UPY36113.1 NADPH-dependent assimilatory sulfite reductase hemoprotein subunit [Sediminicoccus rosea]
MLETKLSGAETIKAASLGLRGPLAAEISAEAARGGLSEAAYTLLKFHGTYEQFDRDTATARKQAGEDKAWSFMVRVRAPAGRLTGAQWLALDALAGDFADGTLRITSRQGVQFHGILRENLRASVAAINATLLTTLAACGDVVRNVITSPAPRRDPVHARLEAEARRLSSALLPKSRAHHEIFLGEDAAAAAEAEPLYGPTYLPRKFKIALIHPDDNTPDVLANDLGFVMHPEGWIVTIGGGMGMTHNKPATFPRLADAVALIGPGEVLEVAEAVVRLARDHGDRSDRKHARLKYVLAERGVAWARARLSEDLGRALRPAPPLPRFAVPDHLGWHPQGAHGGDGRWWLGLHIPAGRVAGPLRAALREVVGRFGVNPIATPGQDLLLADVAKEDRAALEATLRAHGVALPEAFSPIARNMMACVALPSCGQSLAEGERVRQPILAQMEGELARLGLLGERISLRLTGCPNGCARPYQGDIGVVGRAPGLYTLFVGGDFAGTRLSFPLADKVPMESIGATLAPLLEDWARHRAAGEGFGDYCARRGDAACRAAAGVAIAA